MRRSIRIFLPFFLLLFGFLIFSLGKQKSIQKPLPINLGVQSTPEGAKISNDETVTPEPTATAFSKEPTTTTMAQNDQNIVAAPLSQYQTEDLEIFGPPTRSVFSLHTPVTIYWNWPFDLEGSLYFSVYLLNDSGEQLIGSVYEPSLGKLGYQLTFIPFETVESPGSYFFEVRMENDELGNGLIISDQRTLILEE